MSHVQKNKDSWRPSAALAILRTRARILNTIRAFFAARDVLEVETPLLCHTSVTDPYIQSIPAFFQAHPDQPQHRYYLQTSPEYAMKRLLAANSGPIFQITKAFRQGEVGRFHNPEFTMLEWYQPGYNHHDLMNEMDELLQLVLNTKPAERKTYAALFQEYLNIDPHFASLDELRHSANENKIIVQDDNIDRDTWLNLLSTCCIEPRIGKDRPVFIYDFPASLAALARIQPGHPPLAARFEVYMQGIELANGFYELQDANEQRKRFAENLLQRQKLGCEEILMDEYLLNALAHGLPDCAGVALGIDRLIMLATNSSSIAEVLSFDFSKV